jgi:hypothetical protein
MRSLTARLRKLERRQPKRGVITIEDVVRRLHAQIDAMDADDPRLEKLVPRWQLELIREQKRAEAAGILAPPVQLDFVTD